MPHLFSPVLDAMNDGRVIRKAVAATLKVLGAVFAFGGLVLVVEILKYSFRPDTTTEATLGGILFSIILLVAFAGVVEIHFYRARSVSELGETAFVAIRWCRFCAGWRAKCMPRCWLRWASGAARFYGWRR